MSQINSTRRSSTILPSINNQSQISPKKKNMNLNFSVLLNLPVIVKDQNLSDRMQTIDVFKKKNLPQQSKKNNQKTQCENSGRLYINEFWSEKYLKTILNDTKISSDLIKLRANALRNVDDIVQDISCVIQNQQGDLSESIKGFDIMLADHKKKQRQNDYYQSQMGLDQLEEISDQNFNKFEMSEDKIIELYQGKYQIEELKGRISIARTDNNFKKQQQKSNRANSNFQQKSKFNNDMSLIIDQCLNIQMSNINKPLLIQRFLLYELRNNRKKQYSDHLLKFTKQTNS